MPVIMPTHRCFDDALDLIAALLTANPDDREELRVYLVLVHGICRAPDGNLYAHAWVEDDLTGRCLFTGMLEGARRHFAAERADYYAAIQVQEHTRYSVHEATRLNHLTNHYGPWLPRYRALCTPRTPEAP